jgi:predicted polyphosphate/ATP-dependent NAD kinase
VKRLGLIVNPLAGIGGRVGLKGSDGAAIVRKALELGAAREAPRRAQLTLERIAGLRDRVEIVTWPGEMGEDEARAAGFEPTVVGSLSGRPRLHVERDAAPGEPADAEPVVDIVATTGDDTEAAARELAAAGVDLILFAGGDGTARNVFNALGDAVPVVGIPAGVKIHSAVYANTPGAAGDLVAAFLGDRPSAAPLREAEVMDIDEEAFRDDRVSARLYGFLRVPYSRALVQSAKAGGVAGDAVELNAIANDVVNDMVSGEVYLLGPGTTTRAVSELLGLPKTLLGVDAVVDGASAGTDLSEHDIMALLDARGVPGDVEGRDFGAHIVVTVIGGQGHIFGRGNLQFSPRVIRRVGPERVTVIATQTKLLSLGGGPLLVDTGDPALDAELSGYRRVVTGLGRVTVYPVAAQG